MGQSCSKDDTVEEGRQIGTNFRMMDASVTETTASPGPTVPKIVQERKQKLNQLVNQLEDHTNIPVDKKAQEQVDRIIVINNNFAQSLVVSTIYDDPVDWAHVNGINVDKGGSGLSHFHPQDHETKKFGDLNQEIKLLDLRIQEYGYHMNNLHLMALRI